MPYHPDTHCAVCRGEGIVSNESEPRPWSDYEVPPNDMMAQFGIVRPQHCSECDGTGYK